MESGKQKESVTSDNLSLGEAGQKLMVIAAIVGGASLLVAVIVSFFSENWFRLFSFSYLTAFCFVASICIGGLFFVLVLHLTRAGWGVALRRMGELLAMGLIPLLVLFLPILLPVLFGWDGVYIWNDSQTENELIQHKAPYLNPAFFSLRSIIVFGVMGLIAIFMFRTSVAQDSSGDDRLSLKMQARSAPFMFLFAFALIMASFDWQMSLEPEWFSTIFPVYFFAGSVLGCLATLILCSSLLQRSGRLTEDITVDHYHDLSKLSFGFVVFWGYIGFSQYLLIWYANIPEETFWFKIRQENGWQYFSLVLLVGHLFIPMLAIMARTVRRNKSYMTGAAIYLLVMHYLDHFWLVMPSYSRVLPLDFATIICCLGCLLGIGGLVVSAICWLAADRPLIPVKDPRLVESLNYTNP